METHQPPPQQSDNKKAHAATTTTTSTTTAISPQPQYKSYILIDNPKKSNNLGPILRCCAAFAVTQVILVGYEKCSTDGSHGAAKHVQIVAYPTFEQAVEYLRKEERLGGCGCLSLIGLLGGYCDEDIQDENNDSESQDVVAVAALDIDTNLVVSVSQKKVEIDISNNSKYKRFSTTENSQKKNHPMIESWPVHTRSFSKGNCGFVLSKNWRGLPIDHAKHCDTFIHVPHISMNQFASSLAPFQLIDVQSCLSIALHHFSAWAKFSERSFEGQKFEVVKKKTPKEKMREEEEEDGVDERQNESNRKKARIREEVEDMMIRSENNEASLDGGIFGDDDNCGDY